MLRVQEKKYDAAWEDILACHRLGRLTSGGATLIESLVGIAIGQIASELHARLPRTRPLSSKEALASCLKDLQALPPLQPDGRQDRYGERMMGLDSLQLIRRGGTDGGYLFGELFGSNNKPTEEDSKMHGHDRLDSHDAHHEQVVRPDGRRDAPARTAPSARRSSTGSTPNCSTPRRRPPRPATS